MTLRKEIDTEYGEWDDAHGGRVIHVDKLPEIIAKVREHDDPLPPPAAVMAARKQERAKTIERVLAACDQVLMIEIQNCIDRGVSPAGLFKEAIKGINDD